MIDAPKKLMEHHAEWLRHTIAILQEKLLMIEQNGDALVAMIEAGNAVEAKKVWDAMMELPTRGARPDA